MSFDIGRWRAREWFVLGCAVVLLLVSLSDWYGISVRDAGPSSTWRDVATADAWRASTAWTLAIGVTAFAVALWLAHRGQAAQPSWVRRTAVALVLAALGAVGYQYLAMGDLDHVATTSVAARTGVVSASVSYAVDATTAYGSELTLGGLPGVDRDDLVSDSRDGYRAGPRWGMTAGTTLLAVLLLALLTTPAAPAPAGRPRADRPQKDGPPGTGDRPGEPG